LALTVFRAVRELVRAPRVQAGRADAGRRRAIGDRSVLDTLEETRVGIATRLRVLGGEYGRIDKRELRKRIGLVNSVLVADLPGADTTLEVVASGLRAQVGKLGAFRDEELLLAERALARVRAEDSAKKRYSVLSQGERQRVMIARALVCQPRLLVLDEPCCGLDPVARERFLSDVTRLTEGADAPTQLHVTHHLDEIPSAVTHALLLREGRVVAQGRASEVLTSAHLSAAFGATCQVETQGEGSSRYRLRVSIA
jgi:iron complex transport system ATP-binding protein